MFYQYNNLAYFDMLYKHTYDKRQFNHAWEFSRYSCKSSSMRLQEDTLMTKIDKKWYTINKQAFQDCI